MESAIAPVMSSVTVALTVRSPSASEPISSSRRRIASWLRWLSSWVVHLQCVVHLRRRRAAGRQAAHHFVELRLQVGDARGEAVGVAGQAQHRGLGGDQLFGVAGDRRPGLADLGDLPGYARLVAVAVAQGGHVAIDAGLGLLEVGEGFGVAGDRLPALDRQLLRQHLQAGGRGTGPGQAAALPGRHAGVQAQYQDRDRQHDQPEADPEVAGLAGYVFHRGAHGSDLVAASWCGLRPRLV
jgi:hypothetical protein